MSSVDPGEHGPSPRRDESADEIGRDPELAGLIRDADERDPLLTHHALASVESRMFGETGAAGAPALDRYVLLNLLGRGGHGGVFAAYDPVLDRKVAIKLLRPVASAQHRSMAQTRLLREAQALAQLSHPNVVAIHDIGTCGANLPLFADARDGEAPGGDKVSGDDEQVYIVMEFVAGATLDVWLAAQDRTFTEILDVFSGAARGLLAAHERGLVHRDFKPQNVVIPEQGRARVLDFGLVRAADESDSAPGDTETWPPRRAEGNLDPSDAADAAVPMSGSLELSQPLTRDGTVMGTPGYMAPEQRRGKRTGPAADVYALCLCLYKALYDRDPPQRGETGDEVNRAFGSAVRRRRIPSYLRRAILRGLADDPRARGGVADVLSALRRARERRRRLTALAIVGGAAAIILGVVGWGELDRWRAMEACERAGERAPTVWAAHADAVKLAITDTGVPYARHAADAVESRLASWAEDWRQTRVQICVATDIDASLSRELSDRAEACLDMQEARLEAFLDSLQSATPTTVASATTAAWKLPRPADCADVDRLRALAWPDSDRREAVNALRIRLARLAGRGAEHAKQSLAKARMILEESQALGWTPLTAEVRVRVGLLQDTAGDYAAAEESLRRAYFEAGSAGEHRIAARAATRLVSLRGHKGRQHEQGLEWGEHARMQIELAGPPPSPLLEVHIDGTLAIIHERMRDYEKAQFLFERALRVRRDVQGDDHPELGGALGNLAVLHKNLGNLAQARALYEQALAIGERALGPNHPNLVVVLSNLGNLAGIEGNEDEAVARLERAYELQMASVGREHPNTAYLANNLGNALATQGDRQRARELLDEALSILRSTVGPEHPSLTNILLSAGGFASRDGRHDEAIRMLDRALEIRETTGQSAHARAEARFYLARAVWESGAHERGHELAEAARAECEKAGESSSTLLTEIQTWLDENG